MLSETDVLDAIAQLFPVHGEGFSLELVDEDPPRWTTEALHATVRLVVREADEIRDIKEQTIVLLPQPHRTERGLAYLEAVAACVRELPAAEVETSMPMDLFAPALLDAPLEPTAFMRTLQDTRARMILELRPTDPALLETLDPATWQVTIAVNEALERDIAAALTAMPHDYARDPEGLPVPDPGAFAVYGDWLSERGDPRGELVSLHIASAAAPHPDLDARAAALIDRYSFEWLGPLAWGRPGALEATWRHGFLERLAFGQPESSEYGATDTADELAFLRTLPGIAFLQAVELREKIFTDDGLFAAIGEGLPPSVRSLAITTRTYEAIDDVAPAYPGLASLEALRLDSRGFDLGTIELPALRSLELVTRGLTTGNLASLRDAAWPHLERLVLWIGDAGVDDCDVTLDELAWIFDGTRLPALRALGLCGRSDARSLLERLVVAPVLPRLEVLDLAGNGFSEQDLGFLRGHGDKLAHLARVGLAPPWGKELVGLPGNIVRDDRFVPVYE